MARGLEVALSRFHGVSKIGRKDEQLPFDPMLHEFSQPTRICQMVIVLIPGWKLSWLGEPPLICLRAIVQPQE